MAQRKKGRRKTFKLKPVPTNCIFCKQHIDPDYKDAGMLEKYVTDRGKILPKSRSGVCSKHQRKLAVQIKRARHLGLLPFV